MREIDEALDKMARTVIGAAIEVHRTLGPGFLESMYEEALCIELEARDTPFERQVSVTAMHRGKPIGSSKLDLLVGHRLIVELQAVDALAPVHVAQALPINFNVKILRGGIQRIAL